MPVTMYHNPRCNTSRRTLALLREKGVEPTIIEYLKTPYTAAQLKKILGQLKRRRVGSCGRRKRPPPASTLGHCRRKH